jgi:hypothetical protein
MTPTTNSNDILKNIPFILSKRWPPYRLSSNLFATLVTWMISVI